MTINTDFLDRWLKYCDHRNDTAHLYGETLAEATLDLLPAFIADAMELAAAIAQSNDD